MTDIIGTLLIITSYLVGAFPTGYFFSYLFGGLDITKHGSGNPGATNVARVLGTGYFFPIFFIDAGKAFLMLYGARSMGASDQLCVLLAAALLIGNSYSVFLNWGGGKGVATSFGCIAFLLPWYVVTSAICCWGLIALLTKHAFFGSLGTFFLLFLGSFVYTGGSAASWLLVILWLWLVIRHYPNIRLFMGLK